MPLLLLLAMGCPHPSSMEEFVDDDSVAVDTDPLSVVVLPQMPLWTDKYSKTQDDMGRFFRIEALMEEHGFSRLQAVEVQNHFRDLQRQEPGRSEVAHLQQAVRLVKGGVHESGLNAKKLEEARFIVVFDLDDTLYDQYYPAEVASTCHTAHFQQAGRDKFIQMAPGWDSVLRAVSELGGASVIFSANLDEPTLDNLGHIELGDTSLRDSPLISGVMTNSFLIMQHKSDGRPVSTPSKDLRIVDETLDRVIIVDDNPTRLFQFANTRVFRKFHADDWCATTEQDPHNRALHFTMREVELEIRESATAMTELDLPFATAYLPYSATGRLAVDALMQGNDWSHEQAALHLRKHPDLADRAF